MPTRKFKIEHDLQCVFMESNGLGDHPKPTPRFKPGVVVPQPFFHTPIHTELTSLLILKSLTHMGDQTEVKLGWGSWEKTKCVSLSTSRCKHVCVNVWACLYVQVCAAVLRAKKLTVTTPAASSPLRNLSPVVTQLRKGWAWTFESKSVSSAISQSLIPLESVCLSP